MSMRIKHNERTDKSFKRLNLKGDGWGQALIYSHENLTYEWWEVRWNKDQWETTEFLRTHDRKEG